MISQNFRTRGKTTVCVALSIATFGCTPAQEFLHPGPSLGSSVKTLQATDDAVAASVPAATAGMGALRSLAARSSSGAHGFASPLEADDATLGNGLAVVHVPLDRLKRFDEGENVFGLLLPVDEVFWTVSSGGSVKSSITTYLRDGIWSADVFGRSNTAKLIDEARGKFAAHNEPPNTAGEFLVSVPALQTLFVARQSSTGRLVLAAIAADVPLKFKQGSPVEAEDLFVKLANLAENLE
jgi:hypothetical protein